MVICQNGNGKNRHILNGQRQKGHLPKWSTALWTTELQNYHLKFPSTGWQG